MAACVGTQGGIVSTPARVTIVGGYGHVGTRIARHVLGRTSAQVRIAGPAADRARRAADRLGCEGAVIDVSRADSWDAAVADADVVMVCIGQGDNRFASHVLSQGKAYLDITAAYSFIEAVESLDDIARSAGAKAVLSIGFAPGLTNLLVRSCSERLDSAERARIGVLLGLGDAHGEAAILWTLGAAGDAERGRATDIRFGRDRRIASFPFPFADQHVVRKTLGIADAQTFLAIGNEWITRLLYHGAQRLAGRKRLQRVIAALLARVRIGSDRAALAVEVFGLRNGRPSIVRATCEGRREGDITALVAGLVVERLLESPVPPGIHHIEQVVDPDSVYAELGAHGVAIAFEPP
jgi:saccharopine dehydrogenase (NAD+, L-lysine forming)